MADYLQLGPNDYLQFPDGLNQAAKQQFAAQAINAYQQRQLQTDPQGAINREITNPSTTPELRSDMVKQAAPAAASQMTTPGQVLREENNPLSKGLSDTASEAVAGGSQVVSGGMLEKLLGLARMANAPAVGAGRAVGQTVQNVLANTVPEALGGGAGGVIPAGGAALADAATQLFTGPKVIQKGIQVAKEAYQIPARILAPGLVRKAGQEAIAMGMGQPGAVLERVFQTPASKAAYTLAESQGAVPTADLADTIQQAFFKHADLSNPNNGALGYLSNLEAKFRGTKQLAYGDVMEEIQALKARADSAFNSTSPTGKLLGQTLSQAREYLIQELDKISPLYRQANRLYRQESAVTDVMNAVRQGTPGANLEKLIENNPDVAHAFSKNTIKNISQLAGQLSDVASTTPAGGFRQAAQAISKPVMDMLFGGEWGRALLRQALRAPGDQLPRALAGAVQTYRAIQPRDQNP